MPIAALYIAATGMQAQEVNVDNVSNNIANTNTTGFKRGRVNFADLLYQNTVAAGVNSSDAGNQIPAGVTQGLGVRVDAIYKVFEQGTLNPTPATPLNLGVDGVGFFRIQLPSGDIAYTRDGAFVLNADGNMVNSMGYLLDPPINIPTNSTNTTITTDGKVSVTVNSAVQEQGTIQVTRFANNSGLVPIGGNLYIGSQASGDPVDGNATQDGFGKIMQNYLENSNVNTVIELTELIKAQRAFEYCSKALQTAEQMLSTVIDSKV